MRKLCGRVHFHSVPLAALLSFVASTASADPITIPGYTVTDVGSGTSTFSTGASGNGILNAPNGQSYAFQQPSGTILTPGQGIAAGIPLLSPLSYPPDPHQTELLLTPDGLSPDPIQVPVPEPGALAVMLVAIAGFVTHRICERNGQI